MNGQQNNEYFEIDLLHLIKLLWSRAWIIILCMIILGGIAFSYALFFVTPIYESTAMLYVNNTSFSVGSTAVSISTGQLSAAKSLLETYIVILKTRTTLEAVIEKAELDYTYQQLNEMISASAVNETEVFSITVKGPNPDENKIIVDAIVEVLPDRISDIIDGSSVRLVDNGIKATQRSSPSYTKYAVVGMLLGIIISCGTIIVIDLFDSTVRDEDYLKQKYNIPVLAVIPDVYESQANSYNKKYYRNYYYSYGRKNGGKQ